MYSKKFEFWIQTVEGLKERPEIGISGIQVEVEAVGVEQIT